MSELNEKLAKWAGFRYEPSSLCNCEQCKSRCWIAPNTKRLLNDYWAHSTLPNFLLSLDACFEWLVPKLTTWHIVGHIDKTFSAAACIDNYKCGWAEGETPALALCKAIEKLIDGGEG